MPLLSTYPLGDAAMVACCHPAKAGGAGALARACRAELLPGVTDVVAAFDRVGVYFDPLSVGGTPHQLVTNWIQQRGAAASERSSPSQANHVVPVCYAPPYALDLQHVSDLTGLPPNEVVRRHQRAQYRVGAIGFTPGFAYLQGLPRELHAPRQVTPRTSTPAGAVGIGGAYSGVYPRCSPGGWNIVGNSPARPFNWRNDPPLRWSVGDSIRFAEISEREMTRLAADTLDLPPPSLGDGRAVFVVRRPGVQSTLQDPGRPGYRHMGVALSGAMDWIGLRIANVLAGNPPDSPVLEAALAGPRLECVADVAVGLSGGTPTPVGGQRRVLLRAGQTLDLGHLTAARAYLAIEGGFVAQQVLGSSSTDLTAGVGGQAGSPLRKGDVLLAAASATPCTSTMPAPLWKLRHPILSELRSGATTLRVVAGPQWDAFTGRDQQRFTAQTWQVDKDSSRMGIRLSGPALRAVGCESLPSQPVTVGVVQVPPGGQPIVLGADCQTLGGYPVIACVISADLPVAGQLRPGNRVCFRQVTLEEALAARNQRDQHLKMIAAGVSAHHV